MVPTGGHRVRIHVAMLCTNCCKLISEAPTRRPLIGVACVACLMLKRGPSVEENLGPLIDYQMKILKKIIKFFLRNSWTRNMFSCWAANRWLCPFRVAAWKAKKYRTGGRWACWWTIEPRAPSDRAITPVSTSVQYPQKVSWSSTSNSNSGKLPFARL